MADDGGRRVGADFSPAKSQPGSRRAAGVTRLRGNDEAHRA